MCGQQIAILFIDGEVVEALAAGPGQIKFRNLPKSLRVRAWPRQKSKCEAGTTTKPGKSKFRSHVQDLAPLHRMRSGAAFAELVESGFESGREFFGGPSAPIVQEDDYGPIAGHVVMNRDNVETIFAESFEN